MERFLIHRREPFEVAFLAFLLTSGIAQLLTRVAPGTVDALLPHWFHLMWAITLIVGCASSLYGVLCKNVVSGLFFERWGLSTAGASLAIYGAASLVVLHAKGILTAGICIGITVAFIYRRRELNRVIRKLPRK